MKTIEDAVPASSSGPQTKRERGGQPIHLAALRLALPHGGTGAGPELRVTKPTAPGVQAGGGRNWVRVIEMSVGWYPPTANSVTRHSQTRRAALWSGLVGPADAGAQVQVSTARAPILGTELRDHPHNQTRSRSHAHW
jgi:hypothetical protein